MMRTISLTAALLCVCAVAAISLADGPDGNGKPENPPAIENAQGVAPAVLEFILANDPPYGSQLPGVIEEYRNAQGSQNGNATGGPENAPPETNGLGAAVTGWLDEGFSGTELASKIHDELGIDTGLDGPVGPGSEAGQVSVLALDSCCQAAGGPAAVPEPATLSLVALGVLAVMTRKSKIRPATAGRRGRRQ